MSNRVKHLITVKAFVEGDNPDSEILFEYVLKKQQEFMQLQLGVKINLVEKQFTVQGFLKDTVPRRSNKDYPAFLDHSMFPIIKSTGTQHLVLMDARKGIFAYRVQLPMDLITTLEQSNEVCD